MTSFFTTCRNKGEDCAICLDEMNTKDFLFKCIECNKCIHFKCMVEYNKNVVNLTCPNCREPARLDISLKSDNDFDPHEYAHGRSDNSVPLAIVEVVLIGVFALPIFGLTGGLIDPITTSTLIHQTLSLGLSTTVVHPMFRN